MSIGQVIVDEDGYRAVLVFQARGDDGNFFLRYLETGPSIPLEGCCFRQATQAADQAAGGHGKVVLSIFGAFDGDGQAVGDEKQSGVGFRAVFDGRHCDGGGPGASAGCGCDIVLKWDSHEQVVNS